MRHYILTGIRADILDWPAELEHRPLSSEQRQALADYSDEIGDAYRSRTLQIDTLLTVARFTGLTIKDLVENMSVVIGPYQKKDEDHTTCPNRVCEVILEVDEITATHMLLLGHHVVSTTGADDWMERLFIPE